MSLQHLTVGDLHLTDKEMRSTKRMVENSRVILEKLYNFIKENKNIVLLNINGDIQHRTPTYKYNRQEVAYWRKMFKKIGELMLARFKKLKGYALVGASEKVKDKFKKGEIYPIFTTKGNHDKDSEIGHTFYDDLIEEGLIVNVEGLLVTTSNTRTYFSYRDYGIKDRKVPKFKKKTDIIALEHNDVLHDESMLWKVPNAEKKYLKSEEVSKGVDVVLLHHIHDKVDPLYISDTELPVLWQVGSMARTVFDEESKRDVGYGALMSFGDVKTYKTVEFDLIPYKEYFSFKKMVKQKKYEKEFKDFSLKMDTQERVTTNFYEDINSFEGVSEKVKQYAIGVMEDIEYR